MKNMAELYILTPVWMILTFTQGHRIVRKLDFVQSFCCKVAWSCPNIQRAWLCKWDDCPPPPPKKKTKQQQQTNNNKKTHTKKTKQTKTTSKYGEYERGIISAFSLVYIDLTWPRTVFNMHAHVGRMLVFVNHVRYIRQLSHATYCVPCGAHGWLGYCFWQIWNCIFLNYFIRWNHQLIEKGRPWRLKWPWKKKTKL